MTSQSKLSLRAANMAEYYAWKGSRARCNNPRDLSYQNYGGRGIRVCERWLHSFANFFADMGPKPEGHSLDRIDVNGDYSPDNCRWATIDQQNNNMRKNIVLTFYGQEKTVAEWSRISLVKANTIQHRLVYGWHPKLAVWLQPGDKVPDSLKHLQLAAS